MINLLNQLLFKAFKFKLLISFFLILLTSIVEGLLLGTLNIILINLTDPHQLHNTIQHFIIFIWNSLGIKNENLVFIRINFKWT